ncbi:MAG: TlpA family protein disulfide reductase [Ginsengibacter sp.]
MKLYHIRYRLIFLTILFIGSGHTSYGQTLPKELKVGDKMPDVVFNNLMNYSKQTARLSDFRGKIVVLDMWSSWCGYCIGLFPHMDSLQRLHSDKLQILLVNGRSKLYKDNKKKIGNILDNVSRRTGKPLIVPVVYNCPALDDYFPFKILPHEIVIDKEGYIIGITSSEEISFKKIKELIDGKPVAFSPKADIINYDDTKPLFINGNGGPGKSLIGQSVFAGYTQGISAMTGYPNYGDSSQTTFRIINNPLMSLCGFAYPKLRGWPASRIVLEVRDPKKYQMNDNEHESISENREKYFCYELILPGKRTMEEMMDYFRDDLKRNLNISFRTEHRKVKCYFLTATSAVDKLLSDSGEKEQNFFDYSPSNYIKNWTIAEMTQLFDWYFPLYDLTSITKKISMEIPKIKTEESMKQSLLSAGFLINAREMEIEVTVISDR